MITNKLLSNTDRCTSSVNITSVYMAGHRVIAEHNQAELSKLEAQTANSV